MPVSAQTPSAQPCWDELSKYYQSPLGQKDAVVSRETTLQFTAEQRGFSVLQTLYPVAPSVT
jgi:hypothetical protein